MNKEELIEVLRQFDEKRVEELPEKTRNIFYAIMKIADERDRLNNIILNQQKRIDKTIQAIDEILIYNDLSDTTSAFGNAPRELKFYLSECDTLEEFDKLKELKENNK